jgi:hypothetical protein
MTPDGFHSPEFTAALHETFEALDSSAGLAAIAADAYWPKWDGPWWRMTLLWELGLAEKIPRAAVDAMITALKGQYLDFFPASEAEIPPGKDVYRHTACHCMVGTIFQVLHARGVKVDEQVPWLREWILQYQLADGGWNCDNGVTRCSSFVSTLPAAEAILNCTGRPFTPAEKNCLDRAAQYLLERGLVNSKSKNKIIDPDWLIPCFPRYYLYDALRGLSFLASWAEKTGAALPAEPLREALSAQEKYFSAENPSPRRSQLTARSLRCVNGAWEKQPAAGNFPLLELTALPETGGARLQAEWAAVRRRINS